MKLQPNYRLKNVIRIKGNIEFLQLMKKTVAIFLSELAISYGRDFTRKNVMK